MTVNKTIKLLLVDDHQMFTDGLKSILALNPHIDVIKNTATAQNAYNLILNEPFDLVITDINLPNMSGIELIKKIKLFNPNLPILVLSMHVGKELVKEILSLETEGYLLKKASKEELFTALEKITDGGTYYSSEITSIMIDLLSHKRKSSHIYKNDFTPREREILHLICREYSSKEIAKKLCIELCTVETHRRSMFQKTNSKSVVGLIRYAVENDLALWS